jgi:hypothetical protein
LKFFCDDINEKENKQEFTKFTVKVLDRGFLSQIFELNGGFYLVKNELVPVVNKQHQQSIDPL